MKFARMFAATRARHKCRLKRELLQRMAAKAGAEEAIEYRQKCCADPTCDSYDVCTFDHGPDACKDYDVSLYPPKQSPRCMTDDRRKPASTPQAPAGGAAAAAAVAAAQAPAQATRLPANPAAAQGSDHVRIVSDDNDDDDDDDDADLTGQDGPSNCEVGVPFEPDDEEADGQCWQEEPADGDVCNAAVLPECEDECDEEEVMALIEEEEARGNEQDDTPE
jgi:hypothetical protein